MSRMYVYRLVRIPRYSRRPPVNGETLINNAQANAREVRLGAIAYADDVLNDLENLVSHKLELIQKDRRELQGN